jgi:hypothetical protein
MARGIVNASSAAKMTAMTIEERGLPLLEAVTEKRKEVVRKYTPDELDAMAGEESRLCAELLDGERWEKLEKRLGRYGEILENPKHPDYPTDPEELAERTARYGELRAEHERRITEMIPRQEKLRETLIAHGRTRPEWTCKCGGWIPAAGATMCAFCWQRAQAKEGED